MYIIKDALGNPIQSLVDPAVIFNKQTGEIHRVGEWSELIDVFDPLVRVTLRVQHGPTPFCLMSLPKDQITLDLIFVHDMNVLDIYEATYVKVGVL